MDLKAVNNYCVAVKKKLAMVVIGSLLFITFGCEKKINKAFELEKCFELAEGYYPGAGPGCAYLTSFIEGVKMYSKCSDAYLIKGIALDTYEYGRYISIDEDLKGNFQNNIDTIMAWGAGGYVSYNRSDYLTLYDNQDVLIMLLIPASDSILEVRPGHRWFEKSGDYRLLHGCLSSVVKLSEGFVTGNILPDEDRMPWNIFQQHINGIFNK